MFTRSNLIRSQSSGIHGINTKGKLYIVNYTSRDIKNIDSKEFIDIIQPDEISDMDDIDEMSDLFNTTLEKALEMLA